MGIFTKKAEAKNYKEFKKVFLKIGELRKGTTFQEVDVCAGLLWGITQEKFTSGKITKQQRETLADMIESVWKERRDFLEEEENGRSFWKDPEIIDLDVAEE